MRLARSFLALCAAAASAGPALAGDIILKTDGKTLGNTKAANPPTDEDYAGSTIEVVEENLDNVTYVIEGVATRQTQPTATVKRVFHDPSNAPPELVRGNDLLDRGRADDARDKFETVIKASDSPVWARAEAAFRLADSYWLEGDAAKAEAELANFKKTYPNSWFVTDATEHRARALLGLDKAGDAKAEFASLKAMKGLPEEKSIAADYWIVWIDERVAVSKNDPAGLATVVKSYDALLAKLAGKPALDDLAKRALVGKASALLGAGRTDEAKAILDKLVADSKDHAVLAAAHTKLGNVLMRQNAQTNDKGVYAEALKHYLRVVVLYGRDDAAGDSLDEAQFHAGELFAELRPTQPDQKEKATAWGQRARREWQELIQRSPGSEWAKRASAALAGMR